MPTGRHARDTAAPVEPTLTTDAPPTTVPAQRATVEVQVATPPGRRRAVLITDDVDDGTARRGA